VGALTLPAAGKVYADAQVFIYTVENHAIYQPILRPLWQSIQAGSLTAISSELTMMESLIGPFKRNDLTLVGTFDQFFQQPGISFVGITTLILREAARLRAATKLRTPDAIHLATAVFTGCVLFITNDMSFRGVVNLPVIFLDDLLKP
jgi:predicted nucleic acid-binding protein